MKSPGPWAKQARCRRSPANPDVNPELWVHEHPGNSHNGCDHREAAHLCRFHCPVQSECFEWASESPRRWQGMVVGGHLWLNVRLGRRMIQSTILPPPPECHSCGIRALPVRVVSDTTRLSALLDMVNSGS
jgi:hypothetical protein